MFKRRMPLPLMDRMRQMVWPRMGWARTYHYMKHRVLRTQLSTHAITGGLAAGSAVSFTPFLGTHFLQTVVLCWIFRFNLLAGAAGTLVGNPWTFPFIFWMNYKIGAALCGLFGWDDLIALHEEITLKYLLAHPLQLFVPIALGGMITAVLAFFIFYAALYYPVRGMQYTYKLRKLLRTRRRRNAARRAQ